MICKSNHNFLTNLIIIYLSILSNQMIYTKQLNKLTYKWIKYLNIELYYILCLILNYNNILIIIKININNEYFSNNSSIDIDTPMLWNNGGIWDTSKELKLNILSLNLLIGLSLTFLFLRANQICQIKSK